MPKQETVVLLHGLSRTTRSMRKLETALQRSGYRVINLAYPAGRKPIEEMPDHLENRLRECCRETGARVHFVTHSFGGIVLRHYLEQRPLAGLGRVVMLSPPNGGSELADVLRRVPVLRSAAGPNRPRLGTDPEGLPARLGPVGFELGVIAGDRSLNPLFSADPRAGRWIRLGRAGAGRRHDRLPRRPAHPHVHHAAAGGCRAGAEVSEGRGVRSRGRPGSAGRVGMTGRSR